MEFPYLEEDEIEAAADGLLQEAFGASDAALPVDLQVIAYDHLYEKQDVIFRDDVELEAQGGERVLGTTQPHKRRILVDAGLKTEGPEGRYRFTVAHELGHWVLHEPLYARDDGQTSLFDGDSSQDHDLVSLERNVFPVATHGRLPPEEWQANRFAIALLIDRDRLRAGFRRRFGRTHVTMEELDQAATREGRRRVSRRLARKSVEGLPPLKDVFGLSTEAMAIALEKRGYVSGDAEVL